MKFFKTDLKNVTLLAIYSAVTSNVEKYFNPPFNNIQTYFGQRAVIGYILKFVFAVF
jgi:hypothetical protein